MDRVFYPFFSSFDRIDIMRYAFVSINSKYIHTSPAVRILNKIASAEFDSVFFEFTIKNDIDYIVNTLKEYDCILFSCYIWNIELIKEIIPKLKDKIICAGGPEVSYDYKNFREYFDYIMLGEGEEIILPLIRHIENNDKLPIGVATKEIDSIPVYVKDLNNVPLIFDTYTKEDLLNRIIYVEFSRGCPFSCSYCLSSVEGNLRVFSKERINEIMEFIKNNKFKCLKFLDRTFNSNPKRFIEICRELEKTDNTYQFEIEAELFTTEVIDYFKNEVVKNKFRLEIGVQTTNSKSLLSVNRKQDTDKLLSIIKEINDSGRVTIHTDLISGLPYETLDSFIITFDKVFSLLTEELQLGFLKMLRGTKIREEKDIYLYEYDNKSPYEVISNKFMDRDDFNKIHKCEESLEFMWNDKRCVSLIKHLIKDNKVKSFFEFFYKYYDYYKKDDPLHLKYMSIIKYLKDINIYNEEYMYDLKLDYLSKALVRPVPFWLGYTSNTQDKEYNYKDLGLDNSYCSSFITKYYDGFIIIKYKDEPTLEVRR